jgi:hypothetical protein
VQVTIQDGEDSDEDDEVHLDDDDDEEAAAGDDVWRPYAVHPTDSRFGETPPNKPLDQYDADRRRKVVDTIGKKDPKTRRAYDNKTTPGTSTLGSRQTIKDSEPAALALYIEIEAVLRTRVLDADQFE